MLYKSTTPSPQQKALLSDKNIYNNIKMTITKQTSKKKRNTIYKALYIHEKMDKKR